MNKGEVDLEGEDEIFEEIVNEEEADITLDAALTDEDEAEGEFVQGSVGAEDLSIGFDATIPMREVDVDEDTEGDEPVEIGDTEPLTELEVTDHRNDDDYGDEIELDLDDVLTTGRTVTEAPKEE
jgi:hypothetical protein